MSSSEKYTRFRWPSLPTIDRSAWVSWASFVLGIELVRWQGFHNDLRTGGTGPLLIAGAVALFFLLVLLIQRHMRLSLLANSFGSPQQLVTSGWFSYSRNPIYVAFLIPIASLGYYSAAAAAVTASVYIVAMTLLVIAREERDLEASFGQMFRDYAARTPRWILFF
jgi:protein-S-isoprenylcysteine O-methyltransferase Ste14